jgi:putative hydrolase of the HAD superfamily
MGNVLVHFSHETMCAQMGALCGLSAADVWPLLLTGGLQWEFERGRLTEDEFFRKFQEEVNCRLDADALRHAACDIFHLNEPIVPILKALKSSGRRLVLLSNTCVSHFEFIQERFGVLQLFDDFVVSYRVGSIKPEPAIFEAALKAVRCEPAECFYTDDIAAYVNRARTFGLHAEVFTDADTLTAQLAELGVLPNRRS